VPPAQQVSFTGAKGHPGNYADVVPPTHMSAMSQSSFPATKLAETSLTNTNKSQNRVPTEVDWINLVRYYANMTMTYGRFVRHIRDNAAPNPDTVQGLLHTFREESNSYLRCYSIFVKYEVYNEAFNAIAAIRDVMRNIVISIQRKNNKFRDMIAVLDANLSSAQLQQRLAVLKGTFQAEIPTMADLERRLAALREGGGKKMTKRRTTRRDTPRKHRM
jgi:hypothetical protein